MESLSWNDPTPDMRSSPGYLKYSVYFTSQRIQHLNAVIQLTIWKTLKQPSNRAELHFDYYLRTTDQVQVWVSRIRFWWRVRISVQFGRTNLRCLNSVFLLLWESMVCSGLSNCYLIPTNLLLREKVLDNGTDETAVTSVSMCTVHVLTGVNAARVCCNAFRKSPEISLRIPLSETRVLTIFRGLLSASRTDIDNVNQLVRICIVYASPKISKFWGELQNACVTLCVNVLWLICRWIASYKSAGMFIVVLLSFWCPS